MVSVLACRQSILVAILLHLAVGLLPASLRAARAGPDGERPGLVLELVFEAGSWQLSRMAEIPHFIPRPPLPPRDPWAVRILTAGGAILWQGSAAAPPSAGPDGTPWLVTVPRLPQAARVALVGAAGQGMLLDVGRQTHELVLRVLADETPAEPPSREPARDSDAETHAQPTWTISGTVRGPDGQSLQRAGVALIPVGTHSAGGKRTTATTTADGAFKLTVPALVHPNRYVIQVHSAPLLRHTELLELAGDAAVHVQLTAPVMLRGAVRNAVGQAMVGALVRAFVDDRFVASSRTGGGGAYDLSLAPGQYRLEVIPSPETLVAPLLDAGVMLAGDTTLDLTLPEGFATPVRVQFSSAEAMAVAGPTRLEIRRDGRLVRTVSPRAGRTADSGTIDPAIRFHEIIPFLTDGLYAITAHVVGFDPVELTDIQVPIAEPATLRLGEAHLWSGVLWSPDGVPLAGRRMRAYSDTTAASVATQTDAGGAFTLPLTPGGLVMVEADAGDDTLPLWHRLPAETASTSAPLVLAGSAPASGGVEPLVQIHGDPNDLAGRINLVIVGDGYTNVRESFTDLNGNGLWDGVVFHDLNGNGLWDTGEPFHRYGNAPAPVAGRNPTLGNEPFADLNRDGLLSRDDQALFDRHADEILRALLGSDGFGWYPELFNVFRLRVVSPQAGHSVRDAAGKVIVPRETALGGVVRNTDRGYWLGADSLLVSRTVQEALPQAHAHVVLLNQPVSFGRANAFVLLGGGPSQSHLNSSLVAHELGHRIAGLADEYVEYADTYTGIEPSAVNVTTLTEPDWVPWSSLMTPGSTVPTAAGGAGVGLFEGAYYRPTGAYRPATACTMASGVRFCPVCTVAIQQALPRGPSRPRRNTVHSGRSRFCRR
jgi:hypothetical protein